MFPAKTKKAKPSIIEAAAKAALDEARAILASDVESIQVRFTNTLDGLVAAIPIANSILADDAKPFYAQVGNLELPDDWCHGPFTYLSINGRPVALYQGLTSAVQQLAQSLSEHRDEKLPRGRYRYALMLWQEPGTKETP